MSEVKIRSWRLFEPRPYQMPILKALDEGFRRVLAILPRRAGKDITALNYVIREMQKNPGVYYYVFPTYSQGRKVIWDSMTIEGVRMLDFFPKPWIDSMNSQEMKVRFKNGSIFQVVGSDNFDRLVGTNPRGVVFSEYALQDPRAYQYIRPILTANKGWALFISTPRGKNHLWEIYQLAQNSPDWYCLKLSVEDTMHIDLDEIEKERAEGIMSDDLIQQEYYTSFELGIEGSYYAKYIDRLRLDHRIGQVPWENGFKVHTAWDLGMRDSTSIIFFQVIGQSVRLIDCYQNHSQGLEHYANILHAKPYDYGKHIAPHDIKVRELGSGITRLEKARELGIRFTLSNEVPLADGIEACKSTFSKIWIDSKTCEPLIHALENYRREYDSRKKVYKNVPLHDWASHFADAYRYLSVSLPKTRDGLSAEEREKHYYEAMYGVESNIPAIFRDGQRMQTPVTF